MKLWGYTCLWPRGSAHTYPRDQIDLHMDVRLQLSPGPNRLAHGPVESIRLTTYWKTCNGPAGSLGLTKSERLAIKEAFRQSRKATES